LLILSHLLFHFESLQRSLCLLIFFFAEKIIIFYIIQYGIYELKTNFEPNHDESDPTYSNFLIFSVFLQVYEVDFDRTELEDSFRLTMKVFFRQIIK